MQSLALTALFAATALAQSSSSIISIPGYSQESHGTELASVVSADATSTTFIIACTPASTTTDIWGPGDCRLAVPTTVRLGKNDVTEIASSVTGTTTLFQSATCSFAGPTGPITCTGNGVGIVSGTTSTFSGDYSSSSISAGQITITRGLEKLAAVTSTISSSRGTTNVTPIPAAGTGGAGSAAPTTATTSATASPQGAASARFNVMGHVLSTTVAGYMGWAAIGTAALAFFL